ncbi:MAG: site-specific DNA-methyltransferase [Desulfurellales bacterium]|nr:MAG: site-specific DNA-methyltransferase [Desulfurellales bacterium]
MTVATGFEEVTIGDCRLILGDCREVLPGLPKVDALVTDPPYEISASGGGIGAKRQYLSDIRGHIDAGFDVGMLVAFDNWLVFCGKQQLIDLMQQAIAQGLRWQLRTWNKTNPTPLTNMNYLPDTEYMVHAFKAHVWQCKKRWIVGNVEKSLFDHPTVKPQYVMADALRCATNPGQSVLDCFMGSGSTGVACVNLGRKFTGIERERKYFDIACERIENAYRQGRIFEDEPARMVQQELIT